MEERAAKDRKTSLKDLAQRLSSTSSSPVSPDVRPPPRSPADSLQPMTLSRGVEQPPREEDSGLLDLAKLRATAPDLASPMAEPPTRPLQPTHEISTESPTTSAPLLLAPRAPKRVAAWVMTGGMAAVALTVIGVVTLASWSMTGQETSAMIQQQPASNQAGAAPVSAAETSLGIVEVGQPEVVHNEVSSGQPPETTEPSSAKAAEKPDIKLSVAQQPPMPQAPATKGATAPPKTSPESASPTGQSPNLYGAMANAVGATAEAKGATAEATGPKTNSAGSTAVTPSQGAIQSALAAVRGSAKGCVAGMQDASRATVTFGSDGSVTGVSVSGPAAGTAAERCIKSALTKATVAPFSRASFAVALTLRP